MSSVHAAYQVDTSNSSMHESSHDEQLRKIQDQVAFYFSTDNLQTDMYLVSQMDKDSWVPISTIAQFSRIRTLTTDEDLIIEALKGSTVVQLDREKRKLRPPKTNERNTIVIRNLNTDQDPDEIRAYFGKFKDAVLNVKPEIGDNWFIDMRNEAVALEAIEHLREQTAPDGMPLAARIRSNTYLRGVPLKPRNHQRSSQSSGPPDANSPPGSVNQESWLNSSGTFRDEESSPQVAPDPTVYAQNGYVFVHAQQYMEQGFSQTLPEMEQPQYQATHVQQPAHPPKQTKTKKHKPKPSSRPDQQHRAAPEPVVTGVWSGVVSGSEADPALQALEESRLEKAGLSMQRASPTSSPEVSPVPKTAIEPIQIEKPRIRIAPSVSPVPKDAHTDSKAAHKPDSKAAHKPDSKAAKPIKESRQRSPPQDVPLPKPKSRGRVGSNGKSSFVAPRPNSTAPSKQWSEEEWLQDTGWHVVGSEAASGSTRTKQQPPSKSTVLQSEVETSVTSSFAAAFVQEEDSIVEAADQLEDATDKLELIDDAARARQANTKGKKGKGKTNSKKEHRTHSGKARRAAPAKPKLLVDVIKQHSTYVAYAVAPALLAVLVYLFVYVL